MSSGEIGEAIWSSQSWQNRTVGSYLTDIKQKMLAWIAEEIMAKKILMKIIDLLCAFFMPTLTFLTSEWNIKSGNVRRLEQYLEVQESRGRNFWEHSWQHLQANLNKINEAFPSILRHKVSNHFYLRKISLNWAWWRVILPKVCFIAPVVLSVFSS